MAVRRYFLGANTGKGFVSLYEEFCKPESGNFLYVIKGGYHIRRYYNKHGHRKLLSMEIDGRARTVKSADQYPCVGKVVEVIRTDTLAAG